jgi:hypothetical protein
MKVVIFGATGMVGRSAAGAPHPKLRGIEHSDLWHYETIESSLSGDPAN